ncbi:MAG: 2Fe-2S iron-sulfur cluster binding domain-containing protein [Candidatus Cloacimonetes bacterium]|nr:2Fe-2S iron-sulfur cluster binding domain-containing protein [Candidatus Cloacimonadota bacterium]
MFFSILNTVLIVSGISGFLALLLVVAEHFFANYGECEIDINKGKKIIKVKGGSSLLSTLNENKIYLASACGGRGSCGFCKCTVNSGAGPLLPTEKPFLSNVEIKENVRLSCQVKIKEDIKIEIEESIFNIRKFKGKVEKIVDLTYDIKELTIKLIEPNDVSFKAGQYVQLEAPKYEKSKQPISRAYSISCTPEMKGYIQLIIRRVPEGICTTYVFDYLKENDVINLTGPFGDFLIQETDADMIFIAGGSGKAPIKSMVEFLTAKNCERRMVYMFGARTQKDLYFTEMFENFENKLANFKYVPVLSQPEKDSDWQGRTGYIPKYFDEFIINPKNTEAYLCGSPGMLSAVVKVLKQKGVPEDKIYFDSF